MHSQVEVSVGKDTMTGHWEIMDYITFRVSERIPERSGSTTIEVAVKSVCATKPYSNTGSVLTRLR